MKVKEKIKVKDIKKLPKDFKVLVIDGIMIYKGVDGYYYKSWLDAAVSFLVKHANLTDIFEYLADIFNGKGIKINSSIIKSLLCKKFEEELKSKFSVDLDELALKTIKEIYLDNLTIEFDFLEGNFYPTDKKN